MSTTGQHQEGGGLGAMKAFNQGAKSEAQSDEPTMRAVKLGGLPMLQKPVGGFGSIQRPTVGLARNKTSFTVTKEWTGVANSKVWEVKGDELDPVPVDYPLERTHREIECEASEVATRISDVLRKLSIETQYNDEKAKAKCKTSDLVKFRIRLYAGGENGHPVVVEVQKRSGSASSFIKSCRAVLNAAEGKQAIREMKKLPPIGAMKCLAGVDDVLPKSTPQVDAQAGLDKVMELLNTKQHDSVVLGLQNLRCLTDDVTTSPTTAILVSKMVVMEASNGVREMLLRFTELEDADEEHDPTGMAAHQRHLSFGVLANALEKCSKDGSLSAAMEQDEWLQSMLLPTLLNCVKNVQRQTNDAYCACLSLISMTSCSEVSIRLLMDSSGMEALQAAQAHGEQFHDLLSASAGKCLNNLLNQASP